MLASSWARFNSIISIPILLLDLNPWSKLCICSLDHRRVSISASTTFHRVSNRPMPCVLVVPFVIKTRTNHHISWVVSPLRHMFFTMSTRHSQRSLCGEIFNCSPGYASRCHYLKCSARRWVCPPALCWSRGSNAASASASDGISSFTLDGSNFVARGRPGVCRSYL